MDPAVPAHGVLAIFATNASPSVAWAEPRRAAWEATAGWRPKVGASWRPDEDVAPRRRLGPSAKWIA